MVCAGPQHRAASIPSILPAVGPCATAVLPILPAVLPNTPAVLPKAPSILPIGLVVHACDVVVVFDSVVVGSSGREVAIAALVAALYGVVVDSDTALVDASRPAADSGLPVVHASDVDNRPVVADNRFGAQSIQVVATNILVGVAAVQPESPYDDLCEVGVGSGARVNCPGTVGAGPGLSNRAKTVKGAPASRGVVGSAVLVD